MEEIFTWADFVPNDTNKQQLWEVSVRDRWLITIWYSPPDTDEDGHYIPLYSWHLTIYLKDFYDACLIDCVVSNDLSSASLVLALNDFLSIIKATKEEVKSNW